jgi:hypothetical protein
VLNENIGKISQNQFSDIARGFENDLIAVFSLMQDDAIKLLNKAEKEGWDISKFTKEAANLI